MGWNFIDCSYFIHLKDHNDQPESNLLLHILQYAVKNIFILLTLNPLATKQIDEKKQTSENKSASDQCLPITYFPYNWR